MMAALHKHVHGDVAHAARADDDPCEDEGEQRWCRSDHEGESQASDDCFAGVCDALAPLDNKVKREEDVRELKKLVGGGVFPNADGGCEFALHPIEFLDLTPGICAAWLLDFSKPIIVKLRWSTNESRGVESYPLIACSQDTPAEPVVIRQLERILETEARRLWSDVWTRGRLLTSLAEYARFRISRICAFCAVCDRPLGEDEMLMPGSCDNTFCDWTFQRYTRGISASFAALSPRQDDLAARRLQEDLDRSVARRLQEEDASLAAARKLQQADWADAAEANHCQEEEDLKAAWRLQEEEDSRVIAMRLLDEDTAAAAERFQEEEVNRLVAEMLLEEDRAEQRRRSQAEEADRAAAQKLLDDDRAVQRLLEEQQRADLEEARRLQVQEDCRLPSIGLPCAPVATADSAPPSPPAADAAATTGISAAPCVPPIRVVHPRVDPAVVGAAARRAKRDARRAEANARLRDTLCSAVADALVPDRLPARAAVCLAVDSCEDLIRARRCRGRTASPPARHVRHSSQPAPPAAPPAATAVPSEPAETSRIDALWARTKECPDGATILGASAATVDLLFICLVAAAFSSQTGLILNPFPSVADPRDPENNKRLLEPSKPDVKTLRTILRRMPLPSTLVNMHDELHIGANQCALLAKYGHGAPGLLRWIIASNRSHLVPIPASCRVESMSTPFQFVLATDSPNKQKRFEQLRRKSGGQTLYAFHGSPLHNWHCILRQGLRNASGTRLQRTGAVHGEGIYLSPMAGTSFSYSHICGGAVGAIRSVGDAGSLRCVAVCEVVPEGLRKPQPDIWVMPNEDQVATRFLFLFNAEHTPSMQPKTLDDGFTDELRRAHRETMASLFTCSES
eukprot:TRINITY_DN32894_c0_g1_i1.p1 TRINITY_DN32894_c0_g1~~TRINITY_DN32894_c0_g1_i1.p1  ORF type:complete len:992 (+),score=237.08 TRINITY_DN32894_c0_g1_i1:409-2976(+)